MKKAFQGTIIFVAVLLMLAISISNQEKISGFAHEVSHVLNSESFDMETLSDQKRINEKIKNLLV